MEETNIKEAIEEIQNTSGDELKKVIEKWFESTRTQGLKLGAYMISAVISEVIRKHTTKAGKVSLNDYRRMTSEILNIITVQLTQQNDSEENITEEISNDE
jgi:hypothetical protein